MPNVMKLRVWWIPQIPGNPFRVEVSSIEEAVKLMDTLAGYDKFQYENNIKPDYSNAGGLEMFDPEETIDDPSGSWVDWYDPETGEDDPRAYLEAKAEQKPEMALSFESAVGCGINSMMQNDATGRIYGLERINGVFEMTSIEPDESLLGGLLKYELVIMDGGNSHGDSWKNIIIPHNRVSILVDDHCEFKTRIVQGQGEKA